MPQTDMHDESAASDPRPGWMCNQALLEAADGLIQDLQRRGHGEVLSKISIALKCDDRRTAELLEQHSFNELHSGRWDQIWAGWRTLFSLALLIQIRQCLTSKYDCLRLIDRALIFGDELCRDQLTSLAGSISACLTNDFGDAPDLICDDIDRSPSYQDVDSSLATPIPRIRNCDLFRFHREFVQRDTPVILEGAIASWPCLTHRSFKNVNYLRRRMGYRTVLVESGSSYVDDRQWHPTMVTVAEFIDHCISGDRSKEPILYLAQNDLFNQIPELSEDIAVPDYIDFDPSCLDDDETVSSSASIRTSVWFGPSGTRSPLHNDPENNLLCQVFGHKYIRLYEQQFSHQCTRYGGSSQSEQDRLVLRNTPFCEALLHPGDVLFIPKRMWHYVESMSISFSVNFWWWKTKPASS